MNYSSTHLAPPLYQIPESLYKNYGSDPNIELLARGGRKTDSITHGCEATTYHSNTYLDGRVKFEKDLMYTGDYTKKDSEK
ncbi:MAG TPA: hypothetical protein VFI73_02280 [Candidatus Nitrosopolaris sp.]|nr:hypothetical protein [Candidatus Nitrosopolaris sp.]